MLQKSMPSGYCRPPMLSLRMHLCSFNNLSLIRKAGVKCPLLCKEFIVEAYQVFKARARCVRGAAPPRQVALTTRPVPSV